MQQTRTVLTLFLLALAVSSLAVAQEPAPAASAVQDARLQAAVDAAVGQAVLGALPPSMRPQVCFAPGTPSDYVEQVTRLYSAGGDPLFQAGGQQPEHQLSNRWTSTASGGGLGQGDPTVLTWSYVADGTSIPGFAGEPTSPSQLFSWLNGIYAGGFNEWHALFVQSFGRWAELTGLEYVYEPNDDGAAFGATAGQLGVRGDVRIGAHPIDGNSGILAYDFFPNNSDMVLDANDSFFNSTSGNSVRLRNVVTHEHGHGLGFNHVCPVNQTKLMEPFASSAFDGPQHDDILGGNRGYGDDFEHNDTSGTASDLGSLGAGNISLTNLSIDDNSDVDWYEFTLPAPADVTVTMTPVGFNYLEGPQAANCTPGTPFNSLTLQDLGVELVDSDGSTVLESSNAFPAGEAEQVSRTLGAGTYFVRVFGGALDVEQLYDLGIGQPVEVFSDGFESGDCSAWGNTSPACS